MQEVTCMVCWLKPSAFMRGTAGICRIYSGFCGRCTCGTVPENHPACGCHLNIYPQVQPERLTCGFRESVFVWSSFSAVSGRCIAFFSRPAETEKSGRLRSTGQANSTSRFLSSRQFLRLLLSDGRRSSKAARYFRSGPDGFG